MKRVRQGEIYFVKWGPGKGHEFLKIRPSLIISSDASLKASSMFSCVPMTSNIKNKQQQDILVKKSSTNRLYLDSVLKILHVTSLDKCRLVRYAGKMEDLIVRGETVLKGAFCYPLSE